LLKLRPLALVLLFAKWPSMFNRLRSILLLPKLLRSILRRIPSKLAREKSLLTLGLAPPGLGESIGDNVAFTASPRTGVVVLMGGTIGLSFVRCIELRLEAPSFGLAAPPDAIVGMSISSGICLAMVSSTRVRRTLRASLPKLKNEKKYYDRLILYLTARVRSKLTSSIA